MTFRDMFLYALQNLWRMKLRSFLTIAGVMIGIGMMVSMLSFGVGAYTNVRNSFESLGLFNTIMVTPSPEKAEGSLEKRTLLNDEAILAIEKIPGVERVTPFEIFTAKLEYGDKSKRLSVQAAPTKVWTWEGYKTFVCGGPFKKNDENKIVLRKDILEDLGVKPPKEILKKKVTLITAKNMLTEMLMVLKKFRDNPFALFNPVNAVVESNRLFSILDEMKVSPFKELKYEFEVCGVIGRRTRSLDVRPAMIPIDTAMKMEKMGFSNIFDLMSSGQDQKGEKDRYASIIVNTKDMDQVSMVSDKLNDLGFHPVSFADNFDEIEDAFFLFDFFVIAIAMVAVIVAGLGIVNTMVMSILERTKEIGVLKALGAEDRHIRWVFITEAGVIGIVGAVCGNLLGWIVARICSFVAQQIMISREIPAYEMFSTPFWLCLIGLFFGVLVSILAGLYPAKRASKVDPIVALRLD